MLLFDHLPHRAQSDSLKWHEAPEGVLPMWVADMDIEPPASIVEAVSERAAHHYFGYPYTDNEIKTLVSAHYKKVYGADVPEEWIVMVPSVIPGVVNALQMMGGKFMYSTPMYDHIRRLDAESGLPVIEVPLKRDENFRFSMDIEALEKTLTPEVKSLILCNPHNPIGRVYEKDELIELFAFAKKHDLLLISDEIHCELDLENRHIPFFTLSEEAAMGSVTLSSAGKICNIPGLPLGFAIIPNETLRKVFYQKIYGLMPSGNVLTLAAYHKAYDGSCDEWKQELREYLKENRDIAESFFKNELPQIKTPHNEGTYLLWLDCRGLGVDDPAEFLLKEAKVLCSSGEIYGDKQCVRFNYGCPRHQLLEALDRIKKAITK